MLIKYCNVTKRFITLCVGNSRTEITSNVEKNRIYSSCKMCGKSKLSSCYGLKLATVLPFAILNHTREKEYKEIDAPVEINQMTCTPPAFLLAAKSHLCLI